MESEKNERVDRETKNGNDIGHSSEAQHHHHHHHSGSHHSSSHHSSSGSESSSKSSSSGHKHRRSSSKRKFADLTRAQRRWLLAGIICIIAVIEIIALIAFKIDFGKPPTEEELYVSDLSNLELEAKINNEACITIDSGLVEYLSIKNSEAFSTTLPSEIAESSEIDREHPITITISVNGLTMGNKVYYYVVEISENNMFGNAKVYTLEGENKAIELKHLLSNTEYFYRVTAITSMGSTETTGSFTTADTPRILSIDGIRNVRDIGNWKTLSDNRIKQGMVYRGTELDGSVESSYHITNNGLIDMLDNLGIATDMDLRPETESTKDALGSRVAHKYYAMVQYDEIFTDDGKAKVKNVFADLANPTNYPIYIHCTYGMDRTGTVCFLLEALLGVSYEDCLKDYCLSNRTTEQIVLVYRGLQEYSGDSLKDKTASYLISCGITIDQISKINDILCVGGNTN